MPIVVNISNTSQNTINQNLLTNAMVKNGVVNTYYHETQNGWGLLFPKEATQPFFQSIDLWQTNKFKLDNNYTISFKARASGPTKIYCNFYSDFEIEFDSLQGLFENDSFEITTKEKRYSVSGSLDSLSKLNTLYLCFLRSKNDPAEEIFIKDIKIEEGTICTNYCMALEDSLKLRQIKTIKDVYIINRNRFNLKKYNPIFNNNSWATIAEAARLGIADTLWKIGDIKTFEVYVPLIETNKTYEAQIIGFNHDDLNLEDAYFNNKNYNNGTNKAAITLQFKTAYDINMQMNLTNENFTSWKDSVLRITYIKQTLSDEISSVVRTVTKKTATSRTNSTIIETADPVFLLSVVEVLGDTKGMSHEGEGSQYKFYADGGTRIKPLVPWTESSEWWTRSPTTWSDTGFVATGPVVIESSGNELLCYPRNATDREAVAPAFCI